MKTAHAPRRQILLIGEGLSEVASSAAPDALLSHAELSGLIALGRGVARPDLVIIDAAVAPAVELTLTLIALGRGQAAIPVLLVGEALSAGLVKALLRLPQSDVVETPAPLEAIVEAARSLLAAGELSAPAIAPRCWAVMGAVGGAGATTAAIEIAANLAERHASRTALFDLNLADGAAAAYLGVGANLQLGRACAMPHRIDPSLLSAFATATSGGFDLFAAPRDAAAFDTATPEAILRLLDIACQVYDTVILDIPRHRHSWTLPLLAGCDQVLVLSELTVPALIAARDLVGELEGELDEGPAPRIVLNRLAKRMFGPAPSVAEAEKALGRRTYGAITSDWESAAAAANLGGPIRQRQPKSRIVKDVANLVERLLVDPANAATSARAA